MKLISAMVFASLWLNQVTENWRPNGDGIMIWSSSCQSLWPASLWSTVITAECRKHSHESDKSWVTRIPLRHKNTFFFFLDSAQLRNRVKLTAHFPLRYPKREQRYIMVISTLDSFAFPLNSEQKSSFSWCVSELIQACEVCTTGAVTIWGPLLLCPW